MEIKDETKKLLDRYFDDEKQFELFNELRKEFSEDDLNDFQMIQVICQKKTLPKCLKHGRYYRDILKKYNFGTLKFTQEEYNKNPHLQKILKCQMCYYFPESRSKEEGYGIFYMDYGRWVPTKSDEERKVIVQAFLIMFEHFMMLDPKNVHQGVSFVMDWRRFGWSSFDLAIEKLFGEVFRYLPARLKTCYMYNCPWYFKVVMKLIKPFFSKKMSDRINVSKEKEAVKFVGKEWFPATIGGDYTFDYRQWVYDTYGIDPFPEKEWKKQPTKRKEYLQKKEEERKREGKEEEGEEEEEEEEEGEK